MHTCVVLILFPDAYNFFSFQDTIWLTKSGEKLLINEKSTTIKCGKKVHYTYWFVVRCEYTGAWRNRAAHNQKFQGEKKTNVVKQYIPWDFTTESHNVKANLLNIYITMHAFTTGKLVKEDSWLATRKRRVTPKINIVIDAVVESLNNLWPLELLQNGHIFHSRGCKSGNVANQNKRLIFNKKKSSTLKNALQITFT